MSKNLLFLYITKNGEKICASKLRKIKKQTYGKESQKTYFQLITKVEQREIERIKQ
jgi:hypothetical protein